jgi:LysR family glycine cleavage system transcriptional activator
MTSLSSLDALHVLATCVRCGSFSRAASELCVTPSAVSARIRNLEAELGVTLFERRGPKLVATDRATSLAATIDGALSSIRSAVDVVKHAKRPLRITCAPTFARWLVPRLTSYHASPSAEPIAIDATTELLPSDRYDVAIRYGGDPGPGVAAAILVADLGAPMLSPKLLPPNRAPSLRGLLALPLIKDPRWVRWFDLAGVRHAKPRFASTSFATYELDAAAAVHGAGVALLSPLFYGDLLASGELVAPFQTVVEGPSNYWALWRKASPPPRFVTWLQAAVAQKA